MEREKSGIKLEEETRYRNKGTGWDVSERFNVWVILGFGFLGCLILGYEVLKCKERSRFEFG